MTNSAAAQDRPNDYEDSAESARDDRPKDAVSDDDRHGRNAADFCCCFCCGFLDCALSLLSLAAKKDSLEAQQSCEDYEVVKENLHKKGAATSIVLVFLFASFSVYRVRHLQAKKTMSSPAR